MKAFFTILFALSICVPACLWAQPQKTITNDDLGAATYLWSNDTTYLLDGIVIVPPGGVLQIEAGTVIKAKAFPTTIDAVTALVIAKGARIEAQGTVEAPIIFTAEADNLFDPTDLTPTDVGLWGGIVLLGDAPIARPGGVDVVEGFNFDEVLFQYGGNDPSYDAGILRYVSIRHAGSESAPNDEMNALSLYGLGDQTTIDHVEAYACLDDGFEFHGGTVNAYYLVSAYNEGDAFDIDLGYRGNGQFWFGLELDFPLFIGNSMLEIGGASPDDQPPFSQPNLANLTLINGTIINATASGDGIYLRDNTGAIIRNSVFVNLQPHALTIEDRSDTDDTDAYARLLNGDLVIENNVFNFEGETFDWGRAVATLDASGAPLVSGEAIPLVTENNELNLDFLVRGSCVADTECLDPRPRPDASILTNGQPIIEAGFTAVNYQGAFGPDGYWIAGWTAVSGDATTQSISGFVRFKETDDCTSDPNASPAPGVIIAFTTDQQTRFATTDSSGFYTAFLPSGVNVIDVIAPGDVWEVCNFPPAVVIAEGSQNSQEFQLVPDQNCAIPTVDLSALFLRRCFPSTYHVSYGNQGTVTAEGVEIEVILDPGLTYLESSLPLSSASGDTLYFTGADLPPFSRQQFTITVEVTCEGELGDEHCTEATITSSNDCLPVIGARLEVNGQCDGDSIRFTIENVGQAPPLNPIPFVVIEDELMLLQDVTAPNPGELIELSFLARSSTFHLATEAFSIGAEALSPAATKTVSCVDNPTVALGAFPSEEEPNFSRDCQFNIGAYDPNDKTGYPLGIGPDNRVPENPTFDYRIRFQNTGTDTAFNVFILDTISELLDLSTIQMGSFSHPMDWSMEGRVLKFDFPNIMLPDSNVNEPLSHGFVKFTIEAVRDLPIGTVIDNRAGIYFDFNEPIITNRTMHEISTFFTPVSVDRRRPTVDRQLVLSPQPAREWLRFSWPAATLEAGTCEVYNLYGQRLLQRRFSAERLGDQSAFDLNVADLATGVYFYRILTPAGLVWDGGKVLIKR
ncbi:MAG: hypothetical protein AAF828_10945 [Bacteroidota bacterium]